MFCPQREAKARYQLMDLRQKNFAKVINEKVYAKLQ